MRVHKDSLYFGYHWKKLCLLYYHHVLEIMKLSIFLVQSIETLIKQHSTVLGPCISGRIGTLEYDEANCFVSDFWPPCVSSWIDRCHSWPRLMLLMTSIAIGHKLGKHIDNEWRISFSQAEQKLVYAMNHTQFSTYGLFEEANCCVPIT